MPRCRAGLTSFDQVLRGRLMQPLLPGRVPGMQLGLEDFPDQMVITIGAGLIVHDRYEHVRAVEELEHLGGTLTAQRGASGHRKLIKDRGGQHELGDLRRLAGQDLLQEVVGDGMAVQLYPASRGGGIGRTVDRDRSHLQPGHPSLAAPVNQSQLWLVQPHAEPGKQTPGLLHRESQVPVPQLDQILMYSHPMHPQRRVNPAGHHQLQRRRMILHQPAQGVGAGRPGQVEVINDQYPCPVRRVKVVSQSSDCIGRYLAIEADQLAGILADRRLTKAIPRGLDNGGDEPGRVGVGRVAAQPRRLPLRAGRQPVSEGHGLARTRRAHHQGEANLFSPVQQVEQP